MAHGCCRTPGCIFQLWSTTHVCVAAQLVPAVPACSQTLGHQPALTQQHCRIKEGGLHTPGEEHRDPQPRRELHCCSHNKINSVLSEEIAKKVKLLETAWALGAWQGLAATQSVSAVVLQLWWGWAGCYQIPQTGNHSAGQQLHCLTCKARVPAWAVLGVTASPILQL